MNKFSVSKGKRSLTVDSRLGLFSQHVRLTGTALLNNAIFGVVSYYNKGFFYLAPEIFDNAGEGYGHSADWWSLGVIVYLMFTRKVGVVFFVKDVNQILIRLKSKISSSSSLDPQFPVFSTNKDPPEERPNGHAPTVLENGNHLHSGPTKTVSNLPNHLDDIPAAAQDLMKRLFERNPRHRLRSVRELERIAMFHQFSFDDCRERKLEPKKFL